MREVDHERDLRLAVKAAGGLCLKLPAFLYRGVPDRLVLLPMGRVYFLELKTEEGRTTKARRAAQARFRKFLRSIGFNAEQIHGKEGVEKFIQEHVNQ